MPVFFGLGIGFYFALPFEPSIWVTLVLIEVLVVSAYFLRRSNTCLMMLGILAIVVLGFTTVQLKAYRIYKNFSHVEEEDTELKGKVVDVDYSFRGMPRISLDNVYTKDGKKIDGIVRLTLGYRKYKPQIGQCVRVETRVYPLMEPVLVGGYQFSRKSFFEGVSATGWVKGFAKRTRCERDAGFVDKFNKLVFLAREGIVERIFATLPEDEAGVVSALVAGETGKISTKMYNQYRDSGLAHFLSISGLHMSMVAGMMFFLVRLVIALIPPLALKYDSKKIAAFFAIVVSGVYLFISGMQIPAQRAFIMTFIVLIGVLISRKAISMLTISWAAMVVLVISPQALMGPSFQMSFAAVVCLIAFYERFALDLRNFLNKGGALRIVWLYIGGILASDLVASLATLPFAIYHFNRIALFTTLGNMMAGPVIGLVIMPFVLLSLILMPFGLDFVALKVTGYGVGIVNDITLKVSSLPNAGYQVLSMPVWGLSLIVIGGLWICIWQQRWRNWGWILVVLGMWSMFFVRVPDVIVGEDIFAVRDNDGEMVVMPSRGSNFEKRAWLEKTAGKRLSSKRYKLLKEIYNGEKTDTTWIDLECDEKACVYGGVVLEKDNLGEPRSIWLEPDGKHKVETVRDYIGKRYWSRD